MVHREGVAVNLIEWNERARSKISEFPEQVKKDLGYLVFKLQLGEKLLMPHSRSMPLVGQGCHRIIIFHAFQKKSEKTRDFDIEIGKKNLKER